MALNNTLLKIPGGKKKLPYMISKLEIRLIFGGGVPCTPYVLKHKFITDEVVRDVLEMTPEQWRLCRVLPFRATQNFYQYFQIDLSDFD